MLLAATLVALSRFSGETAVKQAKPRDFAEISEKRFVPFWNRGIGYRGLGGVRFSDPVKSRPGFRKCLVSTDPPSTANLLSMVSMLVKEVGKMDLTFGKKKKKRLSQRTGIFHFITLESKVRWTPPPVLPSSERHNFCHWSKRMGTLN